jgi:hypothetical protein
MSAILMMITNFMNHPILFSMFLVVDILLFQGRKRGVRLKHCCFEDRLQFSALNMKS